jgi:hypothetical protein
MILPTSYILMITKKKSNKKNLYLKIDIGCVEFSLFLYFNDAISETILLS